MWKQPPELFLTGGLGLLPLATWCAMPDSAQLPMSLTNFVREIDRRLRTEAPHHEAVELMTAAFVLTGMRVEREVLSEIYAGERLMHDSTAYDVIQDEGRAEGRAPTLLRLGRRQFGGDAPAEIESELRSFQDSDRLDRLTDAVFDVHTGHELGAKR